MTSNRKAASFVYIVECSDHTLYTGWTTSPQRRISAHNAGRGAKYTRSRRPVRLVYLELMPGKSSGLSREAQIKKMTATEKRAMIAAAGNCRGRTWDFQRQNQ